MSSYTAFDDHRRIASGSLDHAARAAKAAFDASATASILVFDDTTGEQVDLDFGGSEGDMLRGLRTREAMRRRDDPPAAEVPAAGAAPRGPGRPRLGVVAREVTLLPRHWQWLNGQPGGASVTLRRLVDEARRASVGRDRVRGAQEVAYRVMSALAGNLPGFEEAIRALFARHAAAFDTCVAAWPADVRTYARALASGAFTEEVTR